MSFTRQIQAFLETVSPREPSAQEIQSHLGLSYTQLYRRLRQEGTTCKVVVMRARPRSTPYDI